MIVIINDGIFRWGADLDALKAAATADGWNVGAVRWEEPWSLDDPFGPYERLCRNVPPVDGYEPHECRGRDLEGMASLTHEPAEQPNGRVWIFRKALEAAP